MIKISKEFKTFDFDEEPKESVKKAEDDALELFADFKRTESTPADKSAAAKTGAAPKAAKTAPAEDETVRIAVPKTAPKAALDASAGGATVAFSISDKKQAAAQKTVGRAASGAVNAAAKPVNADKASAAKGKAAAKSGIAAFEKKVAGEAEKLAAPVIAYGKKKSEERRKKDAAKPDFDTLPPRKQILIYCGNLLLTIVCLFVIIGSLVAVMMSFYVVKATKDDGDLLLSNKTALSYTTILYYKDDTTGDYLESQRIFADENRIWVSYNNIPKCVENAAIAIEDQHFLDHHGVDWKRTIAAFINEYSPIKLWKNTQGGSTITQQTIKNITSDKATDSISGALRKMREIYRALTLENNHSKEEIMETYLNTIRLSGQLAGIEAGANAYFNCSTSELTPAKAAAIICVTNAPTKYNPLTNPENNKERREYILYEMHEQKMLTDDEYAAALEESATMAFTNTLDADGNYVLPQEQKVNNSTIYSWFTDMVMNEVIGDLVSENGMTKTEAYNLFTAGGLRVYTTMNKTCQDAYTALAVDEMWSTQENEYGERMQAAMITLNTKGEIVGVMGGLGEKTQSRLLNRAVDTTRSIGSTMKPIGTYGPAIEMNAVTYSTLMPNQPIQLKINGVLQNYPRNFSGQYGTPITVAYAIAQSINTVAVRTQQLIGFEYSYAFLTARLGVSTLDPVYDKTYSSLALGGLYNGISVKEVAAAYVPFTNGGTYYQAHSYTKVTDAEGNVLLDKSRNLKTVRAFSDDTAMIMNRLLQNVITSGTGVLARHGNLPLGGKSGTAQDDTDFLFVCFNPYYVTVTWMGYDTPTDLPSNKAASRLSCKYILSAISSDLPYKDFPVSSGVVALQYCKLSGELATEACSETSTGYYKAGYTPGYCSHSYYESSEG